MSKGPGPENQMSKSATEMKIPSQYCNVDYGKKSKIVKRKVSTYGSNGKFYGSKAILTKESFLDYLFHEPKASVEVVYERSETPQVHVETPMDHTTPPTFINHLFAEAAATDLTSLPDSVVKEIKSNIGKGARDLEQKWKNALELVYKAYQVTGVRRPSPIEKGAWKQFEEILRYGVQQLASTRGMTGDWRVTDPIVSEAQDEPNHIGKRRFFVEVPGESAQEIDGENMDEIIEAITNKIRNDRSVKGTKVRVEERSKKHAILTIWVNDIKRDRIIIKEIS